jgi:hypothetical protein
MWDSLSKNNLFNTREKVFSELVRRNVASVIVSFSGGGDDGSIDGISLLDADGKEVSHLRETYISSKWNEKTKSFEPDREMTEDEMLVEALGQPVYDKYGTFAGDYSVEGEILWDVKNQKVNDSGTQSYPQSYDEDI